MNSFTHMIHTDNCAVHTFVWLQDMGLVKAAAIKDTGHTNECFEEN